jgi:hypothetical protein
MSARKKKKAENLSLFDEAEEAKKIKTLLRRLLQTMIKD